MKRVIVIDNDTEISIIGFAGEPAPRFTYPTIFGVARKVFYPTDQPYYNPEEALANEKDCVIKRPIKDGLIEDWVTMERIWEYSFKKLEIDPRRHSVLLIEGDFNPDPYRAKMAEIMFELLNVGALCIKSRSFLSSISLKTAPPDKKLQAWLGGSIYGSQKASQSKFVTFEEYELEGPITLQKCD